MGFFRSETMQYFKIVIPKTNGVKIMSALETIGHLHFIDRREHTGLPIKTYYSESARKCDELLSSLEALEKKMVECKIKVRCPIDIQQVYTMLHQQSLESRENDEKVFAELDGEIEGLSRAIQEGMANEKDINDSILAINKKISFYQLISEITPHEGTK